MNDKIKNISNTPLDTIEVIYDPDAIQRTWSMEDVYRGEASGGNPRAKWVPKVGDLVYDTSSGALQFLICDHVDETTMIANLIEVNKTEQSGVTRQDTLAGTGPGYQSETWRLLVDKSVIPHVFAVDSRLHAYGTEATKYKVFLGTDVSAVTGKVVSLNFNSNGELLSEDLPLEKVAFPSTNVVDTNVAVKHPSKGYTNYNLQEGEVVTLVMYSDEGHAVSYNRMLVHLTALDRNIEAATRYVTTISIDSPFLDKTESNTLVFPMNVGDRDSLALMGVISYSDGTSRRVPIDQQRLCLSGLDNYVPMKEGQLINLVLTYHLPNGEVALNASNSTPTYQNGEVRTNKFVSVKYFGRTLPVDGSYNVNIFPIPTYVSAAYGWRLRYFLYTLDRDRVFEVTNQIEMGSNTRPYNPLNFSETQDITVALDLSRVDPSLRKFRHVQSFKIALTGHPSTTEPTAWFITYEKDQEPIYGKGIQCKAVNDPALNKWQFDLRCGETTLEGWLNRVYYPIKPLYDRFSESRPMRPTHFTITIDGTKRKFPINAWNTTIPFPIGAQDGYGVLVQWSRMDGNNEYELGISPFNFVNMSENGVVDHAGTTILKPTVTTTTGENASTLIDIEAEVNRIASRNASIPVQELYRRLLTIIKGNGLLRYETINTLFQRIRNDDVTPAMIGNDVILLELEVNKLRIADFNRNTRESGNPIPSMESQR